MIRTLRRAHRVIWWCNAVALAAMLLASWRGRGA